MPAGYGTSNATLAEVMRVQGMLEQQRGKPTASKRGGPASDDMTEYFKSELEAQRQSRVGQAVQKATMFPGMALGTLARYSKELNLEKKISSLAQTISKMKGGAAGGADTEAIVNAITKVGGLGYMASVGPLNVMRQKRLAYERGLKPQLGAVGTGASALDTLSMANRMMITPRILSMLYGGGMPSSLQSTMGLYNAGIPMMKGLANMAGTQLPAGMTSGLGGAMTGMFPFMAAQMGLSMWKQKKIAAITAQRKAGSQEEAKLSLSRQLDSQINQLAAKGLIQPGEQIRIQLLKWIESHTAVLPEIWSEQQYLREEKEKGTTGGSKAYAKGLGDLEDRGFIATLVDRAEGFTSKALSKYDIFGQIFNFLSTGKLPKQFQQELEMAYQDLTGKDRREAKKIARERGLSLDQSRLLEMPSKRVIDMAPSHEAKMLTILGASFDVQRLMASELLTVRKSGFGIPDTAIKSDQFEKSTMGKLGDFLSAPFRAAANIPGVNALLNMAKFPFKLTGMARGAIRSTWGGIRSFLTGGEDVQRLLQSESELRKEAGIYKSPQEMSYEFVGRGLPDIMEEMRSIGWRQVQELANIYTVVAMHLQATTGIQHKRDDKTFSEQVKRGAWSYTAGKYLDERGLQLQKEQDRERMEVALERAFKGSGADRLGWLVDALRGKKRGEAPVLERLAEATEKVTKMEELPFKMLQKAEGKGFGTRLLATLAASPLTEMGEQYTFTPEEVMQAAFFRQRETKGRGRARVVEGWLGAKQERAQMAMESDVVPKLVRSFGLGVGGITSASGMASLGILASLASGGSLLPVILAASAGGALGSIPQTWIEFSQTQKMFPDISYAKMKEAALGFTRDIPGFMSEGKNKKLVRDFFKESYGEDFVKKIGADKDAFFENLNNMPYVVMALQGSTGAAYSEELKESGLGALQTAYNVKGRTLAPGSAFSAASGMKTIHDLYTLFSKDDQPYARVIIAGIEEKLVPFGPLPVRGVGASWKSGPADDYKEPTSNVIRLIGKKKGKSKEEVEQFRRDLEQAFVDQGLIGPGKVKGDEPYLKMAAATGGTVVKTGTILAHKGEEIVPPGGSRTLGQELKEVAAKKKEEEVLDIQKQILAVLQEIDTNTEETDDRGRGKKSGKLKEGITSALLGLPGMIGEMIGILPLIIGSAIAGDVFGGTGGMIAAGTGAAVLGTKTGRGLIKKGLKSGGKQVGKLAGKGLARMGIQGGVRGAAGMAARGAGRGLLAAGRGVVGGARALGGATIGALLGVGGTAYGAMKAQEKYGDVIGEDLSLMEKIGLGAGTGLKAMTFGLLDVEKLTGAKDAREQAIKSKENLKSTVERLKGNLKRYSSPNAFAVIQSLVVNDDWVSAFSSAKKTGKIFRDEKGTMWITSEDQITLENQGGKPSVTVSKVGVKWSSLLRESILQYRFYKERGNKEGMQKVAQDLYALEPKFTPDQLLKLYESTVEKKAGKDVTKKDQAALDKIKTQISSSRMGAAAALAQAESQYAPLQTESSFNQPGFFDRMSREGGIFGAISSFIGNVGITKQAQDVMSANVGTKMSGGQFIWPGSNYITSPFGPRNTGLPGASKMHRGVDMRASDVVASADGKVIDINSKWGGVTIDHGSGIYTRYLHMGPIAVKKGDMVTAGQKIGVASNVGPIEGMKPHLHYEIKAGNTNLDPELVFNNAGKFAPKYAPDISPERQLSAKLSNKPIDLSKAKTEGAEAAGPLDYMKYDPVELRGSLSSKINQVQSDNRRKEEVKEYTKPSAPQILPIPMLSSGNQTNDRAIRNKSNVLIDPELDQFINAMFRDCAYEFGNRYKNYVYHSNVGHSFI